MCAGADQGAGRGPEVGEVHADEADEALRVLRLRSTVGDNFRPPVKWDRGVVHRLRPCGDEVVKLYAFSWLLGESVSVIILQGGIKIIRTVHGERTNLAGLVLGRIETDFVTKYSLESARRDQHNPLRFTALHS